MTKGVEVPAELINGAELAKRLGVAPKTITVACQKGRIRRDEKMLYSWPQVKIDFEESRSAPRNPGGNQGKNGKKEFSMSQEQKLLVMERRKKIENENRVLSGQYVSRKDVQKAIAHITTQLKSEFQNFATRLAPSLSAAIIGLGPTASAIEIEVVVRKTWENEAYKHLEQILGGEILK